MSTILHTTSSTRPAHAAGRIAFETDTGNLIISDGTSWRVYANDGKTVRVASFDGTDDRVELGDLSVLNSASAFSLSLWIKSSATISSTSTFDLFSSGSDGFYEGIFFYLTNTGLDVGIGGGSSTWKGLRYATSVTDGNWYHLVFTFNANIFNLYVNGSLATTSVIGSSSGSATINSTVSTAGGGAHLASRYDDTREFNGSLDDFAIFNTALTSTQVADIYNNDTYPSSVQHRYTFDTNFDDSVGSNNGTGQNDAAAGIADFR